MVCPYVYTTPNESNVYVTPHFKVKEFRCKDGSNIVLVHPWLPEHLEKIRSALGNAPITINSGYRTVTHNKEVGGSDTPYHLYGLAADIVVEGKTPLAVARKILKLFPDSCGIGLYSSYVHFDARVTPYRYDHRSGREIPVKSFN